MRLAAILLSVGAALLLVASTQASPSASLPPGWAPGPKATDEQGQVNADTTCADNSVLVFSARGSGDVYGGDLAHNKIGAWTQGAGIELIHEGWNVRDLQAIYPAPGVPSFGKVAAAALAGGAPGVALVFKDYRDAATKSWPSVMAELEAAYRRCPTRPILLAGYSQGAILLRYIVPRLPANILARIVSVDLIGDPTEQGAVDSGLQHPVKLDGRLTVEGIDTFAGLAEHAGSFRQTAYPASLRARVYQYCMSDDFVCNVTSVNLRPTNAANEGGIHASYGFETIGIAAGKRAGTPGGGASAATLTASGLGGLQVGTPLAQIQSRKLIGPTSLGCELGSPRPITARLESPLAGIATFEGAPPHRLVALSVSAGARTDRGIAIGDPMAKVLRAYPGATVFDARPGDPLQFHAVEVKAANGANIVWFMLDKAGGKVTSFELPSPQFCE